jgi:tyrosyl-tRNA synthetase
VSLTYGHLKIKQSLIAHIARRTLETTEKALADTKVEAKTNKDKYHASEKKLRSLESKLDEEDRESSDLAMIQKRLEEELEDEREQHQKDLSERDFTIDQTRKKYQGTNTICVDVVVSDGFLQLNLHN